MDEDEGGRGEVDKERKRRKKREKKEKRVSEWKRVERSTTKEAGFCFSNERQTGGEKGKRKTRRGKNREGGEEENERKE